VISEHHSLAERTRNRIHKETLLVNSARWLYPRADAIVAVSRGLAAELSGELHLDPAAVRTIYSPIVDEDLVKRAELPVDHPWFNAGEPPVILATGRLVPEKDHATLLRAFALLRARRRTRLMILGDGEQRGQLEGLAAQLGVRVDVGLPGFEINPYRFMSRAAVFVLSSTSEGFGNVLVEAMACGAPVVSTDCHSGPAEILDSGRYGQLVPVGDPAAMAAAIEATLDDPLPTSLLRSRASDFRAAKSADSYLALLCPGSL
jgi:glycosyltransferase involved in cell wall biosynthesis